VGAERQYSFRSNRIVGGIGADDGFWESLEDGTLKLCRCASCDAWLWPAVPRCADCGSWEQAWVEVAPTGTVYSWTRSHYAFDRTGQRADDVPYVVVLAELPQAGHARVLGVLEGREKGLRIGAPVTATIDPPTSRTLGYPALRWSLAGEGGGPGE
jgi:uncharacterized OB-fold protein